MMQYERKGEWLEWVLKPKPLSIIQAFISAPSLITDEDLVKRGLAGPLSVKWLNRLQKQQALQLFHNRLRLKLFPKERLGFTPEWMMLDILYEDDFCLVVNKPAGIKVHPTEPNETGTLAGAIAAYYEVNQIETTVRHIHRLDEWTSGPVLYAKNAFAQDVLDEAMRCKQVQRRYTAIVKGQLNDTYGVLEFPIGRDRHHNTRRRVSPRGQHAVTHYKTIERGQTYSVVELELETGRTHQIRVHLAHIGHPLFGDRLYAGPMKGINRQALHGHSLRFKHPWEGEWITVEAPLPEDMTALIQYLES